MNTLKRIHDDREEVAVVHMQHPQTEKTIDVFGAPHIASPRFYQELLILLNQLDAVIYEAVKRKPSTAKPNPFNFFDNRQSCNSYQTLAAAITEIHRGKINAMLTAVLKDQTEIDRLSTELLDQLTVVFQGDAIDYKHPPFHWVNADCSVEEVNSATSLFSKDSLTFLRLRAFSYLLTRFPEIAKIAAQIVINRGLLFEPPEEKDSMPKTDRLREEHVYRKVESVEQDPRIHSMGILYGSFHQPSLVNKLTDMGYQQTSMNYLEAIRRKPIINDRPLANY